MSSMDYLRDSMTYPVSRIRQRTAYDFSQILNEIRSILRIKFFRELSSVKVMYGL